MSLSHKKQKIQNGPDKKLTQLRVKINRIDEKILRLLNQRAMLAKRVGDLKKRSGKEIYMPGREEQIVDRLYKLNRGPFPSESIKPVFREIVSACRSLERRLRIAYLGPEATFTHIAAMRQFGHAAEFIAYPSISDVFEEVEKQNADFGVVPVENSTEGVVSHTLDMFLQSSLLICAEVILEIHHYFLSQRTKLEEIKRVYSNSQAMGQCRQWLRKNLPGIPVVEAASTAESAKLAKKDPDSGAIASSYAGDFYGLKILASEIEDLKENYTRFLVIGRLENAPSGNDLTMFMFSVKDEPGILYRALHSFAKRKINLTKIESRPLRSKAWEYVFFLELEGHIQERRIKSALKELERSSVFVKVLGSFPKTKRRNSFVEERA